MRKWIFLGLMVCSTALLAAELKFDVDDSWDPVKMEDECECLTSFFEQHQAFERETADGCEGLTLFIMPRYTTNFETLSNVTSFFTNDSLLEMVEEFGEIDLIASDESSILISSQEHEDDENRLVIARFFLTKTHVAAVEYTYCADDLSGCAIDQWVELLESAEFIDEQTLPHLHYTVELDPSSWTEKEDLDVAQTWVGPNETEVRAIVTPRNTLFYIQNLDDYLETFFMWNAEGILERDEVTALTKTDGDENDTVVFEKVIFSDEFVASLSITCPSGKEQVEWIEFLNQAQLVEN